jgi:hypothetical protein
MRNYILAAGLVAAAVATVPADAAVVCRQDGNGRLAATVVGAGIGAILGRVIAGREDGTAGALIGAAGGGLAGNQLAKSDDNCSYAYGYYDEQNRWHANAISADRARGYYDRDGHWVAGTPNGYYDSANRWVALPGDPAGAGYTNRDGRWVPVAVSGYYDREGHWVEASAPGYYDHGRWVSGPVQSGHYNASGVWVAGSSGSRSAGGGWAAETQPGYYDDQGRWRAGQVTGYYDARGRWVSIGGAAVGNANYGGRDAGPVRDVRTREARIEQRIQRNRDNGTLSRREARNAMDQLASIRREDRSRRRYNGTLSARDEAYLQSRLDDLSATVRVDREDRDNRPS